MELLLIENSDMMVSSYSQRDRVSEMPVVVSGDLLL